MALKAFQKVTSEDRVVNQLQSNVEQAVTPLLKNPLSDYRLLQEVTLLHGQDNVIAHALGRRPVSWLVLRPRSQSAVWENTTNPNLGSVLLLQCSADVVVDIYVF